jgi:hypothetical protein
MYFISEKIMPAVSFYLPESILKELRDEAKTRKISVSRLIRNAVEGQIGREKRNIAKGELLRSLRSADIGTWDEAHGERNRESDDRG